MQDVWHSFHLALNLILSADENLKEIVFLSIRVSTISVSLSCFIGFPLGATIAAGKFYGRQFILIVLNSLMGLPPVVVGLIVYLFLSHSGPLGFMELLYTPAAMIIAQTILITPIIAILSLEIMVQFHDEYDEQFRSFNLSRWLIVKTLLWDGRFNLVTVFLAGFGRANAEVGAVMIVGGNIDHLTRVMTTSIALETSKGNLSLALAFGVILILLSIFINAVLYIFKDRAQHYASYR